MWVREVCEVEFEGLVGRAGIRRHHRGGAGLSAEGFRVARADWLRGVRSRPVRLSELGSDFLPPGEVLPRDASEPPA
jgi:hypothetical protein